MKLLFFNHNGWYMTNPPMIGEWPGGIPLVEWLKTMQDQGAVLIDLRPYDDVSDVGSKWRMAGEWPEACRIVIDDQGRFMVNNDPE